MTPEEYLEEALSLVTREFILLAAKHDVERLWILLDAQDILAYLPSSSLGFTTTLSEYTNPDGSMCIAHFTQQGQFYRKAVENEGPVSYFCDILVSRGAFDIDMHMVSCMVANLQEYPTKGVYKEEVGWLFKVKKVEDILPEFQVEYLLRVR